MLYILAEANSRINDDLVTGDTCFAGILDPFFKKTDDFGEQ